MTNPSTATMRRQADGAARPRVLLLLPDLAAARMPAIRTEIASFTDDYEVAVLTLCDGEPQTEAGQAAQHARIVAGIEAFRPDVLHAHGLTALGQVARLAKATGLPFTIRAHARDSAPLRPRRVGERLVRLLRREPIMAPSALGHSARKAMASEWCLGVLTLPFARPWLVRAGLPEAKLVDCHPCVNVAAFHDRSPNGDGVLHIAAAEAPALPRRGAPAILRLAAKVPDRPFSLHAAPALADALRARDALMGTGAAIIGRADPAPTVEEYKRHRWLVLTADAQGDLADWPLAIAEAQAAGVGVCMPMLHPDLAAYVGAGAGILYETIDELPAIVSAPVPEEMRERGFVQAMKADMAGHRHRLTDMWHKALGSRRADPALRTGPAAVPARLAQPAPAPGASAPASTASA